MKIGNHCILFGPRLQNEMPEIVKGLAAGGCDGVEMGKRFLSGDMSAQILEMMNKYGVSLSAYHVNCLLTDIVDKPEETWNMFMEAAEFLKDYPFKNVLYTTLPMGLGQGDMADTSLWDERIKTKEGLIPIAERLEEISLAMLEKGVQLHLHNHDWEFLNNAVIFETLMDYAPHFFAGLDIGWCYNAGYDAAEVIKKYAHKITYCHLRDLDLSKVGTYQNWQDVHDNGFVDLGEGNVPFDTVLPLLKETVGENGWMTVEYECGPQDFTRYHKATAFVKETLAKEA